VRLTKIITFIINITVLGFCAAAHAEDIPVQTSSADADPPLAKNISPIEENGKVEVAWEWDAYYTDVDINIPLTSKPIPTITSNNEAVIYRNLIEGSFIPRYMVVEASVYPMPALGTYLKKQSPGFYGQGQIGNSGLNIIESLTAGFQEPWAVSMFFGNIAKLERPGETRPGNNMGYTGYLVSTGSKHIKSNVLIGDDWYELEWKIKGKRDYQDEKLDWSFRFGWKFNSNPNITDVKYFSIHRSNLDYRAPFLHWLKNSSIDLKVQFSHHGGNVVREEFMIGKKLPVDGKGYSPSLDVGFVWESPYEYSGSLRDRTSSTLTLLIRPSIEF
jgi:hypothetical protein